MADYGFLTSLPGKDVLHPAIGDLVVSTKYPLAKLDSSTSVSFQNVNIFFAHDPPEPAMLGNIQTTLIDSFPHGYKYKPRFWALGTLSTAAFNYHQDYFIGSGILSAHTTSDYAQIYVNVDSTNVNIYVDKFLDTFGTANDLTATSVKLRVYVFVEDVGY